MYYGRTCLGEVHVFRMASFKMMCLTGMHVFVLFINSVVQKVLAVK